MEGENYRNLLDDCDLIVVATICWFSRDLALFDFD